MRNKRYLFLLIASAAGILWLFLNSGKNPVIHQSFCLFKTLTTLPCPSCGTTHSVNAIISGNPAEAWLANPFGFVVLPVMVLLPLWISFDLILRKNSLMRFYSFAENLLRKKTFALICILLVLINWTWNLYKHLWL